MKVRFFLFFLVFTSQVQSDLMRAERSVELADHKYGIPFKEWWGIIPKEKALALKFQENKEIQSGDIICVFANFLDSFVQSSKFINKPYILLIQEDDFSITTESWEILNNKNLIHCFCANCTVRGFEDEFWFKRHTNQSKMNGFEFYKK